MGSQATLPGDMEEPTIQGMAVGATAYAVSWAMWVDDERRCWLRGHYTVTSQPVGTSNMRVVRSAEGHQVWPPPGATYQREASPAHLEPADTPEDARPTDRPEDRKSVAYDIPVAEMHR